jgi:hypothetical protein
MFSLYFSKIDVIFKIIISQNLTMIYYKSNGNFKSNITFGRTQQKYGDDVCYLALL